MPVDCGCPLIAGSVTPQGMTSMMMRADVFTLLSMSSSAQMMSRGKWSEQIRRGCLLMLELEMMSKEMRKQIENNKLFKNKFRGWHKVLHHKCTRNEVQDVRVLNYPSALLSQDKLPDEDADNIFVYASYLKPGPHHLVVFDPSTQLHCASLNIGLSCTSTLCPEQPASLTSKGLEKKVVPNIWVGWKSDTDELRRKAVWYDSMSGDYNLDEILKDIRRTGGDIAPVRKEQVHALFENYFDYVHVLQKEGMVISEQYPEIDFAAFR